MLATNGIDLVNIFPDFYKYINIISLPIEGEYYIHSKLRDKYSFINSIQILDLLKKIKSMYDIRIFINTVCLQENINELKEILLKASYLLFSKGLLFAEYRSLKNELYNKGTLVNKEENIFIYEGHHRRFIDSMKLLQYLTSIGFGILYFCEDKNLSPYKGDNQTFARIVAQKVR